jgi:hypothetical protein
MWYIRDSFTKVLQKESVRYGGYGCFVDCDEHEALRYDDVDDIIILFRFFNVNPDCYEIFYKE